VDTFWDSFHARKIKDMKIITLKIPDQKVNFFIELIEQLGFEVTDDIEIPDDHKSIVRERIKRAKAEDMVSWKEARKQFIFKDKS
jgi:hypothetical protein